MTVLSGPAAAALLAPRAPAPAPDRRRDRLVEQRPAGDGEGARRVHRDHPDQPAVLDVVGDHTGPGGVPAPRPQFGDVHVGLVGQPAADLDAQPVLVGPEAGQQAHRRCVVAGEQRPGSGPALLHRHDPLADPAGAALPCRGFGPASQRPGGDDAVQPDHPQRRVAEHAV